MLNRVQVSMFNLSVQALIDSGAAVSCISEEFYQYVQSNSQKAHLQRSTIHHVKGVSGQSLLVCGEITIPIVLNRLTIHHTFQVIRKLSRPVILGVDFLSQHKTSINWSTHTLEIQGGITEVPLLTHQNKSCLAFTMTDIKVPSNCEVLIPLRLKGITYSKDSFILEPLSSSPTRFGVLGVKCIANINQGKTVYKILNYTNSDVCIPAKTPIAKASNSVNQIFEDPDHTPEINTIDSNLSAQQTHTLSPDQYIQKAKDLGFHLNDSDLTPQQKDKMLEFLGKNSDVFATKMDEIGTYHDYEHYIDTGDSPTIRQRYYRTSPKMRQEIDRQISDMVKNDILEPAADNAFLSPVVLVRKKDNTFRFACDFRKLNSVTRPITFPQITLQSVVDELGNAKANIFSVLDCFSGFFQLKLHPETKHKTGIITESGCWQFKKLPFGLMNSPAAFTMVMTKILSGLLFKSALAYIDDVLAYSSSFEQHLKHLDLIFDRFRKAGIKFKPSKCAFAKKSVTYLGHTLTNEGISIDKDKSHVFR